MAIKIVATTLPHPRTEEGNNGCHVCDMCAICVLYFCDH